MTTALPSGADVELSVEITGPLSVPLTLAVLRHGRRDPAARIWPGGGAVAVRARRGPVTLAFQHVADGSSTVTVRSWGPGAADTDVLARALLGDHDDPRRYRPTDRRLRPLATRFSGARFPRGVPVLAALVPAVFGQRVTSREAMIAHGLLLERHGRPAPGPLGLRLPPDPATLAGLPYHEFHPLGVDRRRAELVRHLAALAERLEPLADLEPDALDRALAAVPGVGPWTRGHVRRLVHGDPDAVIVGDLHLPHLVTWNLAGERQGSDERMLELLAPHAGQRARVQRHLQLSGRTPPRRGPHRRVAWPGAR